ncbi:hypothetical protein [Blastococcus sp. CT_GayMR16]|uniref:hypothetical protein n=1 Tax=Blastococcus sp. CT_GayMR16 TaxID=2559607 RepID=UPI0010745AA2|nr:hypothetical protein [Blastococcus sp. CT_GayMR16]TFV91412.1 hypothetical protein E4P38_02150 [Blastococcus sp. CT_GayMR16]
MTAPTGLLSWLASSRPRIAVPTITVLYGDLRTGRIIDSLDVTGCSWAQVLNDAGAVDSVTVEEHEVRAKNLRYTAPAAKTFLAVDVDGQIQEAGPIWSRGWDDSGNGLLTLGAAGLWSLFDHRKVLPVLNPAVRVQDMNLGAAGTDLAGIAIVLLMQAMAHVGGNLPLILPAPLAGTRTEVFPGFQLLWLGEQLRQITARENGPDIRFRPRYTADKLGIEWVMEAGTEIAPLLTQAGDDHYFDRTVPSTPVVNVITDEDATVMGQRAWVTGEGQAEGTLIATDYDGTQIDDGYPLLEVDEARSSVTDQDTLDGHAVNLRTRSARPIERWKVIVRAEAARGVLAGDFARVVNRQGHAWLPDGESFMRVERKTGDLGGDVTLEMYELAAV